MQSVWLETTERPSFDSLKKDVKTEVLIIGGGITGILCAYMLKEAGIDYILVEANKICSGITKNTTAKITSQHGLIYDKIIKKYGIEIARLYLEANENAIKKYKSLSSKIECDFREEDAFVYTLDNIKKVEDEIRALDSIGFKAEYVKEIPLPIDIEGAVKFTRQAQFHPLKFIFSISKDLNIYENTKILELTPNGALTNNGKIAADKIVVATHFPFINKHGGYFLKLYQHRSYVLAVKNAIDVKGMYVDESDIGMSFRNYGDLLLIGGGSHRTGKEGGNFRELLEFTKSNFPDYKEDYRWATQDCMSLDGIPYIGKYSKSTPNMYVATGFNKWGMSCSMVAAEIIKDMIMEKESPYERVFSPQRTSLHPQLAVNTFHALMGLLKPTVPRCPHMGCALKYNKAEHSWDCSCHGSRFTNEGKLIDNPATDDKRR